MAQLKNYKFATQEQFSAANNEYEVLPHKARTCAWDESTVLLTGETGEYLLLSQEDYSSFSSGEMSTTSTVFRDLRSRHFAVNKGRNPAFRAINSQMFTRKNFVNEGVKLHIFVLTIRCDHRCQYCQISPRKLDEVGFDMSYKTADAALDRVFESSEASFTIEFQGGEAALAFDLLKHVVVAAEKRAEAEDRDVRFVMTTTLHLLTTDMLEFCRDHEINLSSSLDGPEELHNACRINSKRDSFKKTVAGIQRAREVCGPDSVSALTTVSRRSLGSAKQIVDTYVELGFTEIALRPLSPYGFAVKSEGKLGYSVPEFLAFYAEALEYLIELNLKGTTLSESYATLLLTRIMTPFATGYVDLQSPCAAGQNVLVYNYDGGVFVSDEGRMLAETGCSAFRMGNVNDRLEKLYDSSAIQIIRENGSVDELEGCRDCAFAPYCGADPVYHMATQGSPQGDRSTSGFCALHTGYFELLFQYLAEKNAEVLRVFLSWIGKRPMSEIRKVGYMS
ncbi:His-Xaa-Ser system radical SAM maturase HxsB [Nitrincola sp.]|uniref:His-Xaa-Ser system radical SAM maturase HxsB n=1 Tax=Nitrincola sp. TaxID=1926584 RepID=UPI003A8FABE0